MTNPAISGNDQRVADAIAAGQRLHIGVTLSYCGNGSDKFWSAVWAENRIAINFGPHGAIGRIQMQNPRDTSTPERAAKKMWDLLRTKVGKGYTVVDAAIMRTVPLPSTNISSVQAEIMISTWNGIRDARAMNPRRPLNHPELLGKSQRTPTEGAQVLLDITEPTPPLDTLLASAVADPTERFLPPIVMSRPDVPDEAKFLAALGGTAKVFM